MMRKVPEKRTRMRIRRSRVAEGECLQRRVQLGFPLGLGFEDLGLGVGEDDDVAAAEEGMVVVMVANSIWRMLEKRRTGVSLFCFQIYLFIY